MLNFLGEYDTNYIVIKFKGVDDSWWFGICSSVRLISTALPPGFGSSVNVCRVGASVSGFAHLTVRGGDYKKDLKIYFFFHIGFLKKCNNTGTINNILPSSGCLSDRCLIALFLMSVWQAMSDDDVEETEFLDDAEALFGSQFLGGSNHCPTIPGQHSKALKDPHHPYKSVFLV